MKLTGLTQIFVPFSGGFPSAADPELPACGTRDLLAYGAAWLATNLPAFAGQPVVYQRGTAKVALCATFGRKLLKLDDGEGGVRIDFADRDFVIPASSLVLGGSAIEPRRGDLIRARQTDNSVHIYEVAEIGGSEPAWRYSDPYRRLIRVHAKFVRVE